MYPWTDFTYNPIKGCKHDCSYCYLKDMAKRYGFSMEPRLIEKELKTNLGKGRTIFVGSASDMFGSWVPSEWIEKVLEHCRDYPENTYLFQTKNPERFQNFPTSFPPHSIFGTTLETDMYGYFLYHTKDSKMSDKSGYYNFAENVTKAIGPRQRARCMHMLSDDSRKMISIEPIMDFNLDNFVRIIRAINGVEFVSIGADSKNHHLPEPSAEETIALIHELRKSGIKVLPKANLARIIGKEEMERLMKEEEKEATKK